MAGAQASASCLLGAVADMGMFASAPLRTGGRAHWRDSPVSAHACTTCRGWGIVRRASSSAPEGWVDCPDCDATGRQEVVRFNIAAGRNTFASGVSDDA